MIGLGIGDNYQLQHAIKFKTQYDVPSHSRQGAGKTLEG